MTGEPIDWPRTTGTSLMLVPLGHRAQDWGRAEDIVHGAIDHLGIAVARGLSQCPPYVRLGAAVWLGSSGEDALVFACPADIGVFEAAPLVTAGESGAMVREVATFFRTVTEAALALSPKIAWIVAHEWSPGDRVRWDAGNLDSFVRFATSAGAWRTRFIGAGAGTVVVESNEWPYWFEVSDGRE